MERRQRNPTKSVYVIGPSSTGKTTLCNALAKKLNLTGTAYVTEVARHVMKSKGYTRDDVGSLNMQEDILNAHLDLEETRENSSNIRLWDRSAIDAIVYAILTSPNDEEARRRQEYLTRSAKFQHVLRHYRQSTFILLRPVEEWLVDDGVRSMDNQTECFLVFRKLLSELGITYREVGPEMKELARMKYTIDYHLRGSLEFVGDTDKHSG